jgi:hypothetical protein
MLAPRIIANFPVRERARPYRLRLAESRDYNRMDAETISILPVLWERPVTTYADWAEAGRAYAVEVEAPNTHEYHPLSIGLALPPLRVDISSR